MPNYTYKQCDTAKEDNVDKNVKFFQKSGLKTSDNKKILQIIYCLPKIHKTPIGNRLIIGSKEYNNKPLTQTIYNIFKMHFAHFNDFH